MGPISHAAGAEVESWHFVSGILYYVVQEVMQWWWRGKERGPEAVPGPVIDGQHSSTLKVILLKSHRLPLRQTPSEKLHQEN